MPAGGRTRRRFLMDASLVLGTLYARPLLAREEPAPSRVQTPGGALRGESAGGVRVFRGVPFAEPPVRDKRYRAPEKRQPWSGERDATRFAAAAVQPGAAKLPQSEDCLYLNVWAPEGKGPFPVFVWIHGGGFTGGYSFAPLFDGTGFAREGIIVVTVGYRLGVLGFLDLGPLLGAEYAGSGNNALRDLMAALQWVQANIGAFGGDPARVTVGGESAGAKLTGLLMGTPSAQPLFQQMISESGGAERAWAVDKATAVARGFGDTWKATQGKEPADLRSAPAEALMQAQVKLMDTWPQHFPLRCELDGTLLPRLPVETIAGGSTRGKRLLIGTNRDESALFIGPHPEHDATAADLGNLSVARFASVYEKYKTVYPKMSDEQRRIRALTAEEYWVPSLRVVDAHVKGGGSAWMYRLDFAPTSGRYKGEAYHSFDLELVWDKPDKDIDNAAEQAALARQVHAAWAAFIRGEAPGGAGLPSWPQYDGEKRTTMVLETHSHVELKPQEAELRLWDGVL